VIPSYRLEFDDDEISEFVGHAEQVLRSGRLTIGPFTAAIESSMAELTGSRHAIAVNSCTSALETIFRSLEVMGRKVLVPTNTNFATAAAAIYAGAVVEFYDNGLFPDLADLAGRIDARTAAVVAVHLGGYVSPDLPELVSLCDRHGVRVVEDAAHAHGARLRGRAAGSLGHAAAFSFYPTKVVTTGEGGMITTNDDEIAARARRYRDQGKDASSATHELWGNSWRMSELSAALGVVQLRRQPRDAAHRCDVLSRYWHALEGVGGLSFPGHVEQHEPSGYKCVAVLPEGVERRSFKAELRRRGVQLGREIYEVPLHRQPVFADCGGGGGSYPVADDFCARHVCLPVWRHIEADDVTRVISAMTEALAG